MEGSVVGARTYPHALGACVVGWKTRGGAAMAGGNIKGGGWGGEIPNARVAGSDGQQGAIRVEGHAGNAGWVLPVLVQTLSSASVPHVYNAVAATGGKRAVPLGGDGE